MLPLALTLLTVTGGIGMPAGVHLVDAPVLIAQAPPPLVPLEPELSDAQVSAAQLQVDIEAIRKQRPSLAAPIVLISVGGSLGILGGIYAGLSAAVGTFGGALNPLLIIGIVGLAIGLPMAVIGVWMIINRLETRNRIDAEVVKLRTLLDQRRLQERQNQPTPPPGPMQLTPPQVQAPTPTMVLAEF